MFKKNNFDLKPVKKAKVTFADEIESLLKEGGAGVKKEEEDEKMEIQEEEEKTEIRMRFQNDELQNKNKLAVTPEPNEDLTRIFTCKRDNTLTGLLIIPNQGIKWNNLKTFPWEGLIDDNPSAGIVESGVFPRAFTDSDVKEFDLNLVSYDTAIFIGEFLTVISPLLFATGNLTNGEIVLNSWRNNITTPFGVRILTPPVIAPGLPVISHEENVINILRQRLTDCMGAIFSLMQASEVAIDLESRTPSRFDKYNLPRYEQEYQEEIFKIATEFEGQVSQLSQIIKKALKRAAEQEENEEEEEAPPPLPGAAPPVEKEEDLLSIQKVVAATTAKLYGELKELTKVKKERAELRSEVEKLRRQLASSSVSSTSSTPSSSFQDKEVKKVYEAMLPTALREVMSKLHSYRFVLDLAGKIHVRSEQTMFLFDVLDLVRTYAQKNISLYRDISSVNMDVVKSDVESILSTNVTAFASDARTPDEVLKKVLVPVYLSALENSFLDVQKFTPVKPPTLKSLLIRGKTSERLIGAFINYVAAKYTSDLQIQKNMATTASDKIVQSVAKLQAMQDLKEALKSAGYY